MATDNAGDDFVPEEIESECTQCHESLVAVERLLKLVLAQSKAKLEENLSPVDSASLMLILTYTMNTLFWVYLATQGISPKEHQIKEELRRVQMLMKRVSSIKEASKPVGVRVNKEAAERFVRGALWDQDESANRKRKMPHDNSETTTEPSKRPHN